MDINYKTNIQLSISKKGNPKYQVLFDNSPIAESNDLTDTGTFILHEYLNPGAHSLSVTVFDKSDFDQESAVIIDSISINNITDPKFVWKGVYRPIYPEPWASEQISSGKILKKELQYHSYLGWNGTWTLEFTAPAFVWIHKTLDLGWIYD